MMEHVVKQSNGIEQHPEQFLRNNKPRVSNRDGEECFVSNKAGNEDGKKKRICAKENKALDLTRIKRIHGKLSDSQALKSQLLVIRKNKVSEQQIMVDLI